MYNQNYAKNIGHHAYLRAKDHFTSSSGPWIENKTMFSECAHAHSPD